MGSVCRDAVGLARHGLCGPRTYHGRVSRVETGRRGAPWSALPWFTAAAPTWAVAAIGFASLLLGLLITARPLTSLVILTVYVGASAILSGIAEIVAAPPFAGWSHRIIAVVWIVLGVAVLFGLGRTLEVLPDVIALLLIVGGVASAVDAIVGGTISQRVLATAWAAAQIVFGTLALTWPDVTVLVAAVVFGLRTALFGAATLLAAMQRYAQRPGPADLPPIEMDAAREARPRSRRARAWLAAGRYALAALLLALAAGSWWVSDWLAEGSPVVDAFYDPPDTVPSAHGRLLRWDDFAGREPDGAQVKRILYTTRDVFDRPAIASALVIIPDERSFGFAPVVAWNHGTTGVARGCAPSLRESSATPWAIPALDEAVARGWVVVASDYSGQGAPGVFPYLIGEGEARSSLDAVLATRELPDLNVSRETLSWGHSQGGHAALWMSQIAADYAPSLDIVGTAVLAPVTDPYELAEELSRPNPDPLLTILISWVLVPYADTYPRIVLSDYVAPGGETIVREMTQRCPTEPGAIVSVAAGLGVSEDRPIYVEDLTTGPLGERLADNAPAGPWDAPMLVTWGTADEVIPPRLQQEFVDGLCESGVPTRWVIYGGYEHVTPMLPGSRFLPVLVNWSQARLDGADTPIDDCAR